MQQHQLQEAITLLCDIIFYGQQQYFNEMTTDKLRVYSFEQVDLLNLLSLRGPLTSTQIASYQGLHKSAISARLKKLEENGLISIKRSESDQRVKYAALTAEGTKEIKECESIMLNYFGKLFGDFKEEDLSYFIGMLGMVRERLLSQSHIEQSEENK